MTLSVAGPMMVKRVSGMDGDAVRCETDDGADGNISDHFDSAWDLVGEAGGDDQSEMDTEETDEDSDDTVGLVPPLPMDTGAFPARLPNWTGVMGDAVGGRVGNVGGGVAGMTNRVNEDLLSSPTLPGWR